MNMKKLSILSVSLLLAATSAFAWSKKSENTGNLGRMYISIGGAVNAQKIKTGATTSNPTGAYGEVVFNAPVFKPGVNAFRDIKWAGLDASAFFNYSYSGKFTNGALSGFSNNTYSVGARVTPYLNFETTLPVFKAIKPFGIAYAGYAWDNSSWDASSSSTNYLIYGVGGGVEFVIIDQLSFTPTWQWRGNAESGLPVYQVVTADLTYWVSDQFAFAAFWEHSFGADYSSTYAIKHGDVIGMKFKIGFMR